jgi:hypothetical protein
VNIQTWTNDLSFGLGYDLNNLTYIVGDFAPLPGQPHSIAVFKHTGYGNYNPQVAIFDDEISRPNTIIEGEGGTYYIHASPGASTLYVVNEDSAVGYAVAPSTFILYVINSSGIGDALTNLTGYSTDFRVDGNQLIADSGQELNLQNYTAQGTFPINGLVPPDLENGIVYFLLQTGPVSVAPSAAPIATAACTLINTNFYSISVTNIALTSGPDVITNAVFHVILSGSNYTSASVDYFTQNSNAASGVNYTAEAGTIVFPAGATNKSISIPVHLGANYAPTKTFYLI